MRYLVFGDVHANAAALEAVLADAPDWDEVVFLGDAVHFGPEPVEVLDTLMDLPGLFIAGNHDRGILRLDPSDEPATPEETWLRWARAQLSAAHLKFIDSFEGPTRTSFDGVEFTVHHGDFTIDDPDTDFGSRLWPDTDLAVYERLARRFETPNVLFGHCHVQFRRTEFETTFANPGGAGQPRLGKPLAGYGMLVDGELNFHATEYDVERTCKEMEELPLDDGFLDEWIEGFRTASVPSRYGLREFESLADGPYI